MNGMIQVAEAIVKTDDSLRQSYNVDSTSTVSLAESLMNVQEDWSTRLQDDRNQMLSDSLPPPNATAGQSASCSVKASEDNIRYQTDTQAQNSQTSYWDSFIQQNQASIGDTQNWQTANIDIADGLAAPLAESANILRNPV